tara:strand:- start:389 stop:853 length:465 start_codon:yes stop_codon:yes gene_type:complete
MKKIIIKNKITSLAHKKYNLTFNHQNYINQLYLGIDFSEKNTILKELKKKLSSYLMQDKKKKRPYDKKKYINLDKLLPMLVASKLRCCYCKCAVMILYNNSREPRQWTLDRIDNSEPHNEDNVVIACLKCNLERRRRDNKKFLMGKQLIIHKIT